MNRINSGRQSKIENRMGCVIMASGLGKRFGSNKLMAKLDGEPMIRKILMATEGLFFRRVVVTRHQEIERLCQAEGIPVVLHDLPGRNDTIRLGLEMIGPNIADLENCMFCPSDQPLLTRETIRDLIKKTETDREKIWRLACKEQVGAPVVFPRSVFAELMNLPQGKGGGVVIRNHPEILCVMQIENAEELKDVDTVEELLQISENRFGK